MKKTLLYLITSLVILSSCEKEDDILQPIPTNTTQTTTTNNTDTLIVNGDTTITINVTETELINEGLVIENGNTNGEVTVITNPDNFVAHNNGLYVLTSCDFVMTKLSNSPETFLDTSYTYSFNESECNSHAVFGDFSTFQSFVIPRTNGNNPNHTVTWDVEYPLPTLKIEFKGWDCVYNNGVLSMDLEYTICGSSGPIYSQTSFDVVQYSDDSFDLILDIPTRLCSPVGGNQFTPFTWKSYTKLHFEKE